MIHAAEVHIRDLDHKLRIDRADQYGWLRTPAGHDRRAKWSGVILSTIATCLSWKRSSRAAAYIGR